MSAGSGSCARLAGSNGRGRGRRVESFTFNNQKSPSLVPAKRTWHARSTKKDKKGRGRFCFFTAEGSPAVVQEAVCFSRLSLAV